MNQNNIRAILAKHPLIPVVTFEKLDEIGTVIQKIKDAGISCIEITLRTEIALEAIEQVKQRYGDWLTVGVGTVVSETQLEKVKKLKVDFIVCPGTNYTLLKPLNETGIPFITGVATPSEIMNGMQHGLDTFKFFPANLFGGLDALKAYGQLFQTIKFCPTGGITEKTYQDYLDLDNIMSVGGSWMVR